MRAVDINATTLDSRGFMSASMGGDRDLALRLGHNVLSVEVLMKQLIEAIQAVVMGLFVLAILIAVIKS